MHGDICRTSKRVYLWARGVSRVLYLYHTEGAVPLALYADATSARASRRSSRQTSARGRQRAARHALGG